MKYFISIFLLLGVHTNTLASPFAKADLPYTFTYSVMSVKDQLTQSEPEFDDEQAQCMRKLSNTFAELASVEEYRTLLKKNRVEKVKFKLFDNRASARADAMFQVSVKLSPGYIKRKSETKLVPETKHVVVYTTRIQPDDGWGNTGGEPIYDYVTTYKRVTKEKTVKKVGQLLINGLLDSNGNCLDAQNEMRVELDRLCSPQ